MSLQTLKAAIKSALLINNQSFKVDDLYADFFGANSPSAKTRYKSERWETLVTLANNEFVSANDLIFIACQLAYRSRNNEFKDLIKSIRADEEHPAYDLFDAEGENGVQVRHANLLKTNTATIANLQANMATSMARHDKAEARADKAEAERQEIKARHDKAEARADKLETEIIEVKAEAEAERQEAKIRADEAEVRADKAEARTDKLETDMASLSTKLDVIIDCIESIPEYVYNATYGVLSMFNQPIKDTVALSLKHAGQKVKQYFLQDVKSRINK